MRNSVSRPSRGTRPMDTAKTQATWQGYTDALQGLGFHRDYDKWIGAYQRNYERGRQIAVTIKAEKGSAPKWGRNRKLVAVLDGAFDREETRSMLASMVELFHHRAAA